MVNPIIIDQSPLFAVENWTVFVMDLDVNDEDYALVQRTLQNLDPEMLLFTWRLRQIEVSVCQCEQVVQTSLYRVTVPNDAVPFVHNNTIDDANRYLVHKMQVSDMPEH